MYAVLWMNSLEKHVRCPLDGFSDHMLLRVNISLVVLREPPPALPSLAMHAGRLAGTAKAATKVSPLLFQTLPRVPPHL